MKTIASYRDRGNHLTFSRSFLASGAEPGKVLKCRACGSELRPMPIERMSGADGDVETVFLGTPSLACPQGHEKRYIDPNFGAELAEAIADKIPKTAAKGIVSKRHSCSKCGAALEPAATQLGTFTIPLELSKGEPFRLEIRAPLLRCPSCRQEQMKPELEPMVFEAMANAFGAAKFG